MAELNREALRNAMAMGPMELVKAVNRLDYRRGQFENGLEVIANEDGSDWVGLPSFSMRQAVAFYQQWLLVPAVDMGK